MNSLAKDIEDYYDACFWISDIYSSDVGITSQDSDKSKKYLEIANRLSPKLMRKYQRYLKT